MRCIEVAWHSHGLTKDGIYTVKNVSGDLICVHDVNGNSRWSYDWRFELVDTKRYVIVYGDKVVSSVYDDLEETEKLVELMSSYSSSIVICELGPVVSEFEYVEPTAGGRRKKG